MEPTDAPPGYLSARRVAAELGISLGAVRQLVRRGRLHHTGGTPRQPWYDPREVAALKNQRNPQQRPRA